MNMHVHMYNVLVAQVRLVMWVILVEKMYMYIPAVHTSHTACEG